MVLQRRTSNRWYFLFFLGIAPVTISGCSLMGGSEPPVIEREGNMKVSVQANGQPLKNFETELVHRVELDGSALDRLEKFVGKEKIVTAKRDGRGGFMGLKVRLGLPPDVLRFLGVNGGDVVTAFGTKRVRSESSLGEFIASLRKVPESSMTFERQGVPHKVLFRVSSPLPSGSMRGRVGIEEPEISDEY